MLSRRLLWQMDVIRDVSHPFVWKKVIGIILNRTGCSGSQTAIVRDPSKFERVNQNSKMIEILQIIFLIFRLFLDHVQSFPNHKKTPKAVKSLHRANGMFEKRICAIVDSYLTKWIIVKDRTLMGSQQVPTSRYHQDTKKEQTMSAYGFMSS